MSYATKAETKHRVMKLTQDLREAIKFNHAESCEIRIDNGVYNDLYGDEYVCLIESKSNDVGVALDNEHFILSVHDTITKIPLSAISDINYLYDDNSFYLFFNLEHLYNVNMCFIRPQ